MASPSELNGFDFAIDFMPGIAPKICQFICKKCEEAQFESRILKLTLEDGTLDTILLLKATSEDMVLAEAERDGTKKKPKVDTRKYDSRLTIDSRIIHYEKRIPFTVANKDDFPTPLLNPGERLRLIQQIVEKIPLKRADVDGLLDSDDPTKLPLESDTLISFFTRHQNIEKLTPLHDATGQKVIKKATQKIQWDLPVGIVEEYFGEEVAFYYAWMEHYLDWLTFPAIVGGLVYFFSPAHLTINDNHYAGIYSLVVCLWAFLFVKYWKRKNQEYLVEWDSFDVILDPQEDLRAEYVGKIRVNPVTEKTELFEPFSQKLKRYMLSTVVTLPFIFIVIYFQTIFLNLNAYVEEDSLLFMPFFADLAEPGAMFDPNGEGYGWLAVAIGQPVVTLILSELFRVAAIYTTDEENHRTQEEYDNILILKRFVFEFIDAFGYLFYIAFYNCDVVSLRSSLIALYSADSFRRIFTRAVIPMVQLRVEDTLEEREYAKKKKSDAKVNVDDQEQKQFRSVKRELQLTEYDRFDDFLEMVIQFGYITLFAAAFPLAGILSLVANAIEARIDVFKITQLWRRAESKKSRDIGSWQFVLEFMAYCSIFTNILLFAYASDQMTEVFPWLFRKDDEIKAGMGRYVIGIIFGIEHAALIIVLLLTWLISNTPAWVEMFLERQRYETKQREEKEHQAKTMKAFSGLLGGKLFSKTKKP